MKATQHIKVALIGFVLFAGSLSAYVLLSPTRNWPHKPDWTVDNRGISSISDTDGGVTKTINAITSNNAWNGAGANVGAVVTAHSGSVSGWSLGDNNPMLNFQDPENACTGNCLAATFTGYYTGSRITDADIVTNSSGFSWTSQGEDPNGVGCSNEYYVEGIEVHEVGHGLGLDHSSVSGATMQPTVAACDNGPATTASDDNSGIQTLYTCSKWEGSTCSSASQCCTHSCFSPYPGVPNLCL